MYYIHKTVSLYYLIDLSDLSLKPISENELDDMIMFDPDKFI